MRAHDHDRVVFWDFDGTLAVRRGRWSGALVDAWRTVDPSTTATSADLSPHLRSGFPWHAPDVVRPAQTPQQWWAALTPVLVRALSSAGLDPARAERAASLVPEEYYRLDAWSLTRGAVAALRATAAGGYRNLVLSNHAPELPALVTALGLDELVEHTITSAAVGAEKPHPAIFDHALRLAGVRSADDVWMVGDNPVADVEGSRAAGLRAVLVTGPAPAAGVGVDLLEATRTILGSGLDHGRSSR